MEILTHIPFELDSEALMKRLHIEPGSDDANQFSELLEKARNVGNPKALFSESFIEQKGADNVTIEGVRFFSRTLRMNLEKIERVFPYIVTCGQEVAGIGIVENDFLMEYWLDVIKATLLNAATSYLSKHIDQTFKLGKASHMSPGSGEATVWPIQQQKELFSLFGDVEDLIGVKLTASYLMMPNKTLSGIRFPTEIDFQSCQLCEREICGSRQAPFDKKLWESIHHE